VTVTSNIQTGNTGNSFISAFGAPSSMSSSDPALGSFADMCNAQLSTSQRDKSSPASSSSGQKLQVPGSTVLGAKTQPGKPCRNSSASPLEAALPTLSVSLATIPTAPTPLESLATPEPSQTFPPSEDTSLSTLHDVSQAPIPSPASALPLSTSQTAGFQMFGSQKTGLPASNESVGTDSAAGNTATDSPSEPSREIPPEGTSLIETVSQPPTSSDTGFGSKTVTVASDTRVSSEPEVPYPAMTDQLTASLNSQATGFAHDATVSSASEDSKNAVRLATEEVASTQAASTPGEASIPSGNSSTPTPETAADPTQMPRFDPLACKISDAGPTSKTAEKESSARSSERVEFRKQNATLQSTEGSTAWRSVTKVVADTFAEIVQPDTTGHRPSRMPVTSSANTSPAQMVSERPSVPNASWNPVAMVPTTDPNTGHAAQQASIPNAASLATTDSKKSVTLNAPAAGESNDSTLSDSDGQCAKPSAATGSSAASPSLLVPPPPPTANEAAPISSDIPGPQWNVKDPGASEAVYGSHAATHISSTAVASPVQLARLMESAGQSEMRIGLNTSAFGTVQVRTVVHASEVGVQIGSEKGDLRSLLANDIPGIAHSLQKQDLRLTQVSFQQHGFSYSGDSAQHNSESHPFAYRQNSASASSQELSVAETDLLPELRNTIQSGLSILA
jgi:hypothetical protein